MAKKQWVKEGDAWKYFTFGSSEDECIRFVYLIKEDRVKTEVHTSGSALGAVQDWDTFEAGYLKMKEIRDGLRKEKEG